MTEMIRPPAGVPVPGMPGMEVTEANNGPAGLNPTTHNALANMLGASAGAQPAPENSVADVPKSNHINESTAKGLSTILKGMHRDESVNEAKKPLKEFAQDWDSAEEFVDYLKNTLIPDLTDSGYEATAEDFEKVVQLIDDDMHDAEFVEYLQTTLIPDLKDSGYDYTAQDFETAVDFIKMGSTMSNESKQLSEDDVKNWIVSKINAALISLGVPKDKWGSVEDSVFTAALSGKLGDGTPSDETAQAIADMVTELSGTSAAPAPELAEPGDGEDIGDDVGLASELEVEVPEDSEDLSGSDEEFDMEVPQDEEGIMDLLNKMADQPEEPEQDEFLANVEDEEGFETSEGLDSTGGFQDTLFLQFSTVEDGVSAARWLEENFPDYRTEWSGKTKAKIKGLNAVDQKYIINMLNRAGISMDDHYAEAKERPAAMSPGRSVMIEKGNEVFEATVVDVAGNSVYFDRGDGVLESTDASNVKSLDLDESYISRIVEGEDIAKILDEIAVNDVIKGSQSC